MVRCVDHTRSFDPSRLDTNAENSWGEPSKKPNAPSLSLWLKAAKQTLLGKNMNREMSEVFIFTSSNNGFQQAKQNVQLGHQHASNWIGLRHRRFYLGTGEDNGNP